MSQEVVGINPHRIRSLQVLRGFAACAVVYDHAVQRVGITWHEQTPIANWLAWLGTSGVDLFFLLSGFLMTWLHMNQFGTGASLNFFSRRLVRIAPLYWVLTAIGVLQLVLFPASFSLVHQQITWGWLAGNFLFLPLYLPHMLTVGWTLDYEMYFYVLFTGALVFRRGLIFLAVFLLASFATGQLLDFQHPWLKLASSFFLLEFLTGLGIAVLLVRVRMPAVLGWILLCVGLAVLLTSDRLGITWRFAAFGIPCAMILTGCLAIGFRCDGLVGRMLSVIGDASYSIYLFQAFSVPGAAYVLRMVGLGRLPPNPLAVAIAILGCVGGMLCWLLLEKPLTDRLRRLVAREPGRVPSRPIDGQVHVRTR
jgi:exopolysaccharide production protein ExoZ